MSQPVPQGITPSAGMPYPETTADLNQGANDIKALALAIDRQAPVQRMVFIPVGQFTSNASGQCTIQTGLTTIQGHIAGPVSSNRVLISFISNAGGAMTVKVFNNEAQYTGNFFACFLVWGT